MDPQILQQETNHIKDIESRLQDSKAKLEKTMEGMGAENLQRLKELREDPQTEPHDLLFFMEELHSKNAAFNFKDKYKRLEEFSSLMNEPYFSRLDLTENKLNPAQTIYIGKFGYTEERPVIIDWRAKIASVYYRYRYPQKNISYDTPDGPQTRDLLLKRTYEVDNGTLIKYYNNDIQFDESEIIIGKIEKRTGGVLEDIVETIQESQLDIIEADPRQICIVQGCVGSGKSTVAIHKLSHIFFNYAELIHPERSILVAKNQILVGYLSTLFPKLGIFDINYKSLRELVYNIVFREELKLDIDFDLNTDVSGFGLKEIDIIKEKISSIHEEYENEISEVFESDEYSVWGGFIYNRKATVYENFVETIGDLEEELEMQRESLKENPDSVRSFKYKENIKVLKKLVNILKKKRLRLTETTIIQLCKDLKLPIRGKIGYLDTLVYLFVYSELIGLKNTVKYDYCVLDEGQDFSVLEFLILGKFVINGRLCVLGDLNQSCTPEGLDDWSVIAKVIPEAAHANTFELTTNYRSTKPIIDLANTILSPYTKDYLPKSINRKGKVPVIKCFKSTNELLSEFKLDLSDDTKVLDKSIGVICYDRSLIDEAEKAIQSTGISTNSYIKLDIKQKITYIPKGVYLSIFENVRGLEFSKVYVLGLNLESIKDFTEAKKAFISVTRAMNELSIYGIL